MSGDFFTQATNLLAQQLAGLKGEEIYAETACMDSEIRKLIGVLRGLEVMTPKAATQINRIIPLITSIGKATWIRGELTDLGLRVGSRNFDEVKNTELEETVDGELPTNSQEASE